MKQNRFPAGWDEKRVRDLIDHYESLTDEEQLAEDEAAISQHEGQTVVSVPDSLMPAIRQLLATK